MAANTLKLAFILSATDKMSRIIDEAVKKSTDKLSAFERTTSKIGRSMTKAGTVMLGASAAVGGSILAVGKSTADYAGDMYDMARGAGIGVEAFQKLAYAGRMSGVETEKLSASLVKFDRMVAEATGGNKTYMQTFEDLGIKIKDSAGNLRQPNEIFEDVADIFHNTEDGIGKTALAVELFGKSGADLIPMLNDGKAGLKAFYAEAERLGLALSNEMIAKGDAFSDQLENIGEQVKGVKLQLGAALIPALSAATEKISKVIDKITKWVQENPELAATIGNIAMTTGKWIAILGTAAIAIGSVAFIILQFRKAFRAMSDAVTIGISIFKNIKNTFLVVDKAMKGYTKTQKLATVATKLFNKALKANPILTIISLIIALGAVVYSVIKNWDKIAAWFKKLWDAIVGIFKAAWEAIKKVWSTVTGWFSNLWGGIKAGAGKAWEGIKNTINKAREGVQKAWGSVKGWFSNLWGNVKSGISNAWGRINRNRLILPVFPKIRAARVLAAAGIGNIEYISEFGLVAAGIHKGDAFAASPHIAAHLLIPEVVFRAGRGFRALGENHELFIVGVLIQPCGGGQKCRPLLVASRDLLRRAVCHLRIELYFTRHPYPPFQNRGTGRARHIPRRSSCAALRWRCPSAPAAPFHPQRGSRAFPPAPRSSPCGCRCCRGS